MVLGVATRPLPPLLGFAFSPAYTDRSFAADGHNCGCPTRQTKEGIVPAAEAQAQAEIAEVNRRFMCDF